MIAKKHKVPIKDFPRNSRAVYKGEFFSIRVAPNDVGLNRVGVICKASVFKKATLRNKLRRFVFDAIAESIIKKPERGIGSDLLISLNPPIIELTGKEISSILNGNFIQRITSPTTR